MEPNGGEFEVRGVTSQAHGPLSYSSETVVAASDCPPKEGLEIRHVGHTPDDG